MGNIKKVCVCFILLFLVVLELSAEKVKYLVELDMQSEIVTAEIERNHKTDISRAGWSMPFLAATWQLPSVSSERIYLGIRFLSIFISSYIEAYCRAGYAFDKPAGWAPDSFKNCHFEALFDFAFGVEKDLFNDYCLTACPICDFGAQVFLMPDESGLFLGVGPDFMIFYQPDVKYDCTLFFKFSAGWKFK